MTTAASPPGSAKKRKIEIRHLEQGAKLARQGISDGNLQHHARLN